MTIRGVVSIFAALLLCALMSPGQEYGGSSNARQSGNQQNSSQQNMPTGKDFLTKVAQINQGEVALGKLAQQKGSSQAVKDFGKRMVEDHSQAEAQLQQLASQEDVKLPQGPGAEGQQLKQQLSSASGTQFDRQYIEHMLGGHNQAIAMVENEIEHGRDAQIKAFAEKVLPVIQDHIRIAENVAGKMQMAGKQGLSQPQKAIVASASQQ